MSRLNFLSLTALVAAGSIAPSQSAHAQGLFGRARAAVQRGVERAVEREGEQRADEAVTGAIDDAVGATGAAVPSTPAASGTASGQAADAASDAAEPGAALVNYDFVPGDRVLFADDLSTETLGDFPRRLQFMEGNGETAEWQGRRFFRMTSFGAFAIDLPEVLPNRFTLEFEAAIPSGWVQSIYFDEEAETYVKLAPDGGGIDGDVRAVAALSPGLHGDDVFPVKVMADDGHVKVYMNGTRVANVPTAQLGRTRRITFRVSSSTDYPAYFGDFRVAAGGRDLHAVAEAVVEAAPEAPLVLHGVVFDTGRATLRAESGPTLDVVAQSLQAHPEVRVRVEGHTDDTGSAETNRTLSEARAQAVVAALAQRGVAADRMEAAGFGPDRPAVPNDTPEGRQQNRRVELVRL